MQAPRILKLGGVSLQGTPPARWRRKCVAHMTGYSSEVQKKRDGSIRELCDDQGLRQGARQQGYPDSSQRESSSSPLDEAPGDGSIATSLTNSASSLSRAYKPGPCPFDLAILPLGRPRPLPFSQPMSGHLAKFLSRLHMSWITDFRPWSFDIRPHASPLLESILPSLCRISSTHLAVVKLPIFYLTFCFILDFISETKQLFCLSIFCSKPVFPIKRLSFCKVISSEDLASFVSTHSLKSPCSFRLQKHSTNLISYAVASSNLSGHLSLTAVTALRP